MWCYSLCRDLSCRLSFVGCTWSSCKLSVAKRSSLSLSAKFDERTEGDR